MKIYGELSTDFEGFNDYVIGNTNLCLRAGTQGFICTPESWEETKLLKDTSNNPAFFRPIDPSLGLCVRVALKDLGRLKIPQLVLYAPEIGYPLCLPEKTANVRRTRWPNVYRHYFVTIPMLHVNYGLAFQTCCNLYSVFFSNAWETVTPFNSPSLLTLVAGKYRTFPTGKNVLSKEDIFNYPAPWPVDMDILDQTEDNDLDNYFVAGTGPQSPMPFDAFHRYLAYWSLYYPTVTRKISGYDCGSAGDTRGIHQGYTKYVSLKDDTFVGTGRVWQRYYGVSKNLAYGKDATLGWVDSNWRYATDRGLDYQIGYQGINDSLWQELTVVRAAIAKSKQRKEFKFYPFSSTPKRKDFGRTKIHEAPIKKLSFISQCSLKLIQMSKTVEVDGAKCPMCKGRLVLPKVLANASFSNETMCISCGFKALNNLHYLACKNINPDEKNCMWFNDVDMSEVLSDEAKIKVGTLE